MSVINNNIIAGAAGQAGGAAAAEARSLRFNSADSAYLSRTPSSAGNRTTWTWAGWVKKSEATVSGDRVIFGHYTNSSPFPLQFLRFDNGDKLRFEQYSSAGSSNISTSQVFRDPSAWYHIVAVWDTTNATPDSRHRLYVNGVQVTAFSTRSNPSPSLAGEINKTIEHGIGRYGYTNSNHFNGYLADIYFLDGITPGTTTRVINGVTETILTDFGEFDATTGVWNPKAYTGSVGTNGFHLDFADNSTVAALGTDAAGSNDWTPNNFSVTAGADNDSLRDSPTNGDTADDTGAGGEVPGNYATWNPLQLVTNSSSYVSSFANGNLDATSSNSAITGALGTIGVSSGKWYWEITCGAFTGGTGLQTGISKTGNVGTNGIGTSSDAYVYEDSGRKVNNNSFSSYGASFTNGDVVGIALDLDAGTLVFYKNGSSQGTAYSSLSGTFFPCFSDYNNSGTSSCVLNAGARPFAYTAPSGYKALCTANLPTPTIENGSDYFDTKLYTGNGSTQTISGLGFSPDLVWLKGRSQADRHYWFDTVRGKNALLASNETTSETDYSSLYPNYLQSFNSDGFTLGYYAAQGGLNKSGETYAAWTWDAGSSTVANTDGSITSSVRANASAGFSIVTYVGNNTQGATVGHGLGVAPSLYFVKCRTRAGSWLGQHTSIASANHYIKLETTGAAANASSIFPQKATSSLLYIGNEPEMNRAGDDFVAYCFAPVEGYSAFGSFTGGGSNPVFVYTGFRPKFVLVKNASAGGTYDYWVMKDTSRDPYNASVNTLAADLSDQENNSATIGTNQSYDFVSNGFVNRTTGSFNTSGNTFVWAAFAENPFKYSRAR